MVWNDGKLIHLMTTRHNPRQIRVANQRHKDESVEEIKIPQLVKDYNGGTNKKSRELFVKLACQHFIMHVLFQIKKQKTLHLQAIQD